MSTYDLTLSGTDSSQARLSVWVLTSSLFRVQSGTGPSAHTVTLYPSGVVTPGQFFPRGRFPRQGRGQLLVDCPAAQLHRDRRVEDHGVDRYVVTGTGPLIPLIFVTIPATHAEVVRAMFRTWAVTPLEPAEASDRQVLPAPSSSLFTYTQH